MPLIPGNGASNVRPGSLTPRAMDTPRVEPKLPDECSAVFNASEHSPIQSRGVASDDATALHEPDINNLESRPSPGRA